MARFLYRLGHFAARRKLVVMALWLAVIVAGAVGATTLSGKTIDTFSIPGEESTTALRLMEERFGDGASGANSQIVLQAPDGQTLQEPKNAAAVQGVITQLKSIEGISEVRDPFDPAAPSVSADMTTAYINASFAVSPLDISDEQRNSVRSAVNNARQSGLIAETTGSATQEPSQPGLLGELIGVGVALLVLLITFRSLTATGLNIATALVGVGLGTMGVAIATGFIDLQSTTPILASMLGLAVGIDYALFIVTRFRQQLLSGDDVHTAAATAVGTAGSAVVTAGLTVVIALAGLSLAGIPFLTQMGLAAASTVVIAVLVAITLVPAALSLVGRRVLRKANRSKHETIDEHREPAFIVKWAELVTNRSWIVLLTTAALLAVIAIPAASLKTTLAPQSADGSTERRAEQILSEKFTPGIVGPLLVLLDGHGSPQRAQQVVQQVGALEGVAFASPSGARPDGSAALVTVIPKSAPQSTETVELVKEMRTALKTEGSGTQDPAGADGGIRTYVTGNTAVEVDVSSKLNSALPIYLIVVVGLAFVLLVLVFRSIAVPLVGVLGFLLTIGASFGSMVAVFQWGWLRDIVQPESLGPVLSLAPIIIVGILFGLAMDYQVFLVSRMHESFAHGSAPKEAVSLGFRHAAVVVLAAATIMFAVFIGFVPEGDTTIKTIALTLALGIFFDAVIVRMLLIPAALTLMGRHAWGFPKWLGWLPTLDVEGAALERSKSA